MRIAFIRHSRSCANFVRNISTEHEPISQQILDPALSHIGEQMAREYGPELQARLKAAGFSLSPATIGASHLQRAQQTAQLLFGVDPVILPHITENGSIPENTPLNGSYDTPDWPAFLRFVAKKGITELVVVGHGSFLKTRVWPVVAKRPWAGTFHNLDAFIVEGDMQPDGTLRVTKAAPLRYRPTASSQSVEDKCPTLPAKIHAQVRKMKTRKRRQRGGAATGMPLGFFKDGAQMMGTRADPTGVGLAGTNANWVRTPLEQTGGGRGRQAGGFSPSVMGQFAANGMRLLPPMVAYNGYKMFSSKKMKRKTRRRR